MILKDTWLAKLLAQKLNPQAATEPLFLRSPDIASNPAKPAQVANGGEKHKVSSFYLTETVLAKFAPRSTNFTTGLNQCIDKYHINTPKRMAAFLGQLHVESGAFRYVKELWGPTDWQKKYEGHKGLGNLQPGDGKRFMGRGLIQITGRKNYRECSIALFGDTRLWDKPEMLETHDNACLSAGWYWFRHGINAMADEWELDKITRAINGRGMLHHDQRVKHSDAALKLLT